MKQKVVVRAIISQRGRVLLLRRHDGRMSISGLYELPGGSLHSGEQPVDALKRSLQIHAGVQPETFRLYDVMSFIDPDDHEMQYVFLVYEVGLPTGRPRITLDDEYDHYSWKLTSDIKRQMVTNSTATILNLGSEQSTKPDFVLDGNKYDDVMTFVIHSDGGSRGNPGPSAAAYIITDKNEKMIAQGGKFLGWNNSGMSEYIAVELAIEKAIELGAEVVEFYSDSLMVVNQLNGLFAVKNPDFRKVYDRIMQKLVRFRRITFRHIYREYNRMADGLVNKILDENKGK